MLLHAAIASIAFLIVRIIRSTSPVDYSFCLKHPLLRPRRSEARTARIVARGWGVAVC
jgi:hypothetical protein